MMTESIMHHLKELQVGPEQCYQNMAVYALRGDREAQVDYLTLDEALEQRVLTVTEVDEAGEVPALRVVNTSSRCVLMLDGEELVGAKQNRVLNVTILLAPNSVTIIPVSCIEMGRWSYRQKEFRSPGRALNASLRLKKTRAVHLSARHFGTFHSNQGEIWDEIAAKFRRAKVPPSPTQALSDLFEVQRDRTEDYLRGFAPVEQQLGLAVSIDGALAGVELLGRHDTLQRLYRKLVGSYVMDALETLDPDAAAPAPVTTQAVQDFLTQAGLAVIERRRSVALGWDFRLEADTVIGAGLEFEGQILQLSLFPQERGEGNRERTRPLRQASRRRRNMFG